MITYRVAPKKRSSACSSVTRGRTPFDGAPQSSRWKSTNKRVSVTSCPIVRRSACDRGRRIRVWRSPWPRGCGRGSVVACRDHRTAKLELVGGFLGDADLAFNVSMGGIQRRSRPTASAQDKREVTLSTARQQIGSWSVTCKPWGVVAARGQWYVVGHDLDRMTPELFDCPGSSGKVEVGKEPDAFSARRCRSAWSGPHTSRLPDADVVVELGARSRDRLRQLATSVDDNTASFEGVDPDVIFSEVLGQPDARVVGASGPRGSGLARP